MRHFLKGRSRTACPNQITVEAPKEKAISRYRILLAAQRRKLTVQSLDVSLLHPR